MRIVLFLILGIYSTQSARGFTTAIGDSAAPQKCNYYYSGENEQRLYCKPVLFEFFRKIPCDYRTFAEQEFKKDQIKKYAAVVASTGILIWADQAILDNVQQFGNDINVPGKEHVKTIFKASVKVNSTVLKFPIHIPDNLNTCMYFIGDGITHFSFVTGFWAIGNITKNYRAQQTGSQILEQVFAGGIVTQLLKHITGRESPFVSTKPRGVWRFFPNQKDYANHVPHYDAFPSGHLTTSIGTVTVIAENYPEYRFIRPVGYSLCGLLSFAMINNGVHWISDYPLAIALGYSFGKIASGKGIIHKNERTESSLKKKNILTRPVIYPSLFSNSLALTLSWQY